MLMGDNDEKDMKRHIPCGQLVHVSQLREHALSCPARKVPAPVESVGPVEDDDDRDEDSEDGETPSEVLDPDDEEEPSATDTLRRVGETLVDIADGSETAAGGVLRAADKAFDALQEGLTETAFDVFSKVSGNRERRKKK